jgi:hypothetical protein
MVRFDAGPPEQRIPAASVGAAYAVADGIIYQQPYLEELCK